MPNAWDTMRNGDMINERAVRILLECILVMENGIVKAGLPNNGNHVFEVLSVSTIHTTLRHDGCFLTFDDLGNQESDCSISLSDAGKDHATQFTMTLPSNFKFPQYQ